MMKMDLEIAQRELSGSHLEAEEALADDFDEAAALPQAEARQRRPEVAPFDGAPPPASAEEAKAPRKRRALA